jgi:hypothetical protein
MLLLPLSSMETQTPSLSGDEASLYLLQEQKPIRQGYLYRQTRSTKQWRRQWFVLRDTCLISYKDERVSVIV